MPKISIIVPVYNTEKYLVQCFESLINQTFSDIEIICVNDGSDDNSLKILEEYAQKDERIKIFSQKNQGAGVARNFGMAKAKAEYIMFCDSDDFYELQMCEKMFKEITENNVDICFCNSNYVQKNEGSFEVFKEAKFKLEGYQELSGNTKLKINTEIGLPNKIFKKSLINKHGIVSPNSSYGEDTAFWIQYVAVAKNGYFINENLYNYVFRSTSLVNNLKKTYDVQGISNALVAFLDAFDFAKRNNVFNENRQFYFQILFQTCDFYWRDLSNEEFINLLEKMSLKLQSVKFSIKCNFYESFFRYIKKKNYKKVLSIFHNMDYYLYLESLTFWQKIFSLRNVLNQKILCILGMKFRFERKKKHA